MAPEWIEAVQQLAKEAGKGISKIYQQQDVGVQWKADNSPLTEADTFSHELISKGLKKLTPDWPIISEEGAIPDFALRKQWERFWLIDPLDGTKEFINKTGEFTVNIALIEQNRPILGIVYVPIAQKMYVASDEPGSARVQEGDGNWRPIKAKQEPQMPMRVTVSRRHGQGGRLEAFLNTLDDYQLVHCGSTLKICLIAEGRADIYPRFGKTSEWDTGAGQCILEAAGGKLIDFQGHSLQYNTKDSLLNPEFIAVSHLDAYAPLLKTLFG